MLTHGHKEQAPEITECFRPTWALRFPENLHHNFSAVRDVVGKNPGVIAMVKANGYGHGIEWAGAHLNGLADVLGVASLDEGLMLRRHKIACPLLLAEGIFSPNEMDWLIPQQCAAVVHHPEQARWVEAQLGKIANPFVTKHGIFPGIWLKINTGMGRLGLDMETAQELYLRWRALIQAPIGIMSHFACADDPEHPLNTTQENAFWSFVSTLPHGPITSFCNSAALLTRPTCHGHFVRPGLMLYGINPLFSPKTRGSDILPQNLAVFDPGLREKDKTCVHSLLSASLLPPRSHTGSAQAKTAGYLLPVMELRSRIIAIHNYSAGHNIGYTGNTVCPSPRRIGIAAIGYGDGYPFAAESKAYVKIKGALYPVTGRISMDMTAIDITNSDVMLGDLVVLWGPSLPAQWVAHWCNTSVYTLITSIQRRVFFQEKEQQGAIFS